MSGHSNERHLSSTFPGTVYCVIEGGFIFYVTEMYDHLNFIQVQSNLNYPDIDYPDFSIIRTFSLVPFFFMNINDLRC